MSDERTEIDGAHDADCGRVPAETDSFDEARRLLEQIACAASAVAEREADDFCALFVALLDHAEATSGTATGSQAGHSDTDPNELTSFVQGWLLQLRSHLGDASALVETMEQARAETTERWGHLPDLADDESFRLLDQDPWYGHAEPASQTGSGSESVYNSSAPTEFEHAAETDSEVAVPSAEEISRMLAGLGSTEPSPAPVQPAKDPNRPRHSSVVAPQGHGDSDSEPIDAELYEAFLEDAHGCVRSIEDALFQLESNPQQTAPLQQICRELHTLKGASGSVGLASLAEYLHGVEDSLRSEDSADTPKVDVDSLFECLDTIRKQLGTDNGLSSSSAAPGPSDPQSASNSSNANDATDAAASLVSSDGESSSQDPSVRVKASQLNRLMDMLAELVMLRNRRDTELSQLQQIHQELIHSVSRMRTLSDGDAFHPTYTPGGGSAGGDGSDSTSGGLTEIANDILEVAQQLRDCYQPVADENQAVSSFIRQFRQELVELRRVPVSGLFRRLQRVVRDAARAEGKQVQMQLVGEQVGIERLLQERLYEPLLHIVRNSVSHGIEDADQREQSGKRAGGQLTLKAQSSSDLLRIEICDDGRGLDYDALRRRGLELGLLNRDAAPSREELSQLIFHPGFSTRGSTSQVSGRGVGMDVVADTLQRMRGWVEVDSVAGEGTTVRLTFPLPSVIQHAMVFRAGGQLFAVPMQSVHAAGEGDENIPAVPFSKLFGGDDMSLDPSAQRLVLACDTPMPESGDVSLRRVAMWVDEIVGPEEVVVRPMPPLLKHHPLCSGATLSGMGDVVLVLDTRRLVELTVAHRDDKPQLVPAAIDSPQSAPAGPAASVLVVDDSLSARKRLVRSLRRYDVEIVEASDGAEAFELLKTDHYSAVFSDLEMPRMDGLQLLWEVRQGQFAKPSIWIVVSSRTEQELKQRATELGATGYLNKPLADEALDETLQATEAFRLVAPSSLLSTQSRGANS